MRERPRAQRLVIGLPRPKGPKSSKPTGTSARRLSACIQHLISCSDLNDQNKISNRPEMHYCPARRRFVPPLVLRRRVRLEMCRPVSITHFSPTFSEREVDRFGLPVLACTPRRAPPSYALPSYSAAVRRLLAAANFEPSRRSRGVQFLAKEGSGADIHARLLRQGRKRCSDV